MLYAVRWELAQRMHLALGFMRNIIWKGERLLHAWQYAPC